MLWMYRVLYFLGFLCYIPRFIWGMLFQKKWRKSFHLRLFPRPLVKLSHKTVWLHAVSVGEVLAAQSVISEMMAFDPSLQLVVSTITETGHETAKKTYPQAVSIVYLPFDFSFSINRLLQNNCFSLLILSEGDPWPLFLSSMKQRGAKVIIINGKISEKSEKTLSRLSFFTAFLYSFIDLLCVQHELFQKRFLSLGIEPDKIVITGTTKGDSKLSLFHDEEKQAFLKKLHLSSSDQILVLGSTHDPEEKTLFQRLEPLFSKLSSFKLIVVPRHPDRSLDVLQSLQKSGKKVVLFSQLGEQPWDVLVVDRLGLLTKLYELSPIACVCGSFIERIGGHNIAEPALCHAVPLAGPYMHSQPTLYQTAKDDNALIEVTFDTIEEKVLDLFLNKERLAEARKRAESWAFSLQGGSMKTLKALRTFRFL
jgi:3-deoxy-D-manno-octulosonic-acid transferase